MRRPVTSTGRGPRRPTARSAGTSPRSASTLGKMPWARSRSSSIASSRSRLELAEPGAGDGVGGGLLAGDREPDAERDEALLRAVVQVALEPAPLALAGGDDPAPRVLAGRAASRSRPPRAAAFSCASSATAPAACSSSGSSASCASCTIAAAGRPSRSTSVSTQPRRRVRERLTVDVDPRRRRAGGTRAAGWDRRAARAASPPAHPAPGAAATRSPRGAAPAPQTAPPRQREQEPVPDRRLASRRSSTATTE